MTAQCVRCERPMPDQAYACQGCVGRAERQLADIADMCPAARDVAHGLSRRRSGGGGSGKPGSRLPFDLGATAKLDAVQGELTGWVRHITAERGVGIPVRVIRAASDVIVEAAEWLQGHLEWLRHRQEVSEALSGIDASARVVRGLARGPAEQRYLGPCGSAIGWDDDGSEFEREQPCTGDVFVPLGGEKGSCRACKARWAAAERQEWLDGAVREHAFTAADIADAYGVNVKTIRTWASRGQITEHGRDRDDRPLYNVGEVLNLFRALAVRRAEDEAKRARRAAGKAEEAEDAA